MVKCKKCKKEFETSRQLSTHALIHRRDFKAMKIKRKQTMNGHRAKIENHQISAADLLAMLIVKRDALNQVIDEIRGLVK